MSVISKDSLSSTAFSQQFRKGDALLLRKRFISVIGKVPDEILGVFIVLDCFPYGDMYILFGPESKIIKCRLNQTVKSYCDYDRGSARHYYYEAERY